MTRVSPTMTQGETWGQPSAASALFSFLYAPPRCKINIGYTREDASTAPKEQINDEHPPKRKEPQRISRRRRRKKSERAHAQRYSKYENGRRKRRSKHPRKRKEGQTVPAKNSQFPEPTRHAGVRPARSRMNAAANLKPSRTHTRRQNEKREGKKRKRSLRPCITRRVNKSAVTN